MFFHGAVLPSCLFQSDLSELETDPFILTVGEGCFLPHLPACLVQLSSKPENHQDAAERLLEGFVGLLGTAFLPWCSAQLFLHLHLVWHIWLPPALLTAFVAAHCCQVSISRPPAGRDRGWVMRVHQAAGRLMKHFECYTTGGL